ncbi:MAG: type II toxin-antitoxin system antitoxin SocA domain-containing protein [Candidatus Vogelbacteria bacterium]
MIRTRRLSAKQVAEYFISKAQGDNKPITNKKLQKMLYYAQAWSLVVRDKKLFPDKIEAWVHGPAIRSVYFEYKKFGFGPITKNVVADDIVKISSETKRFLDQVWSVYGNRDAAYLEHLSHSEMPWQKAREGLEPHIGSENVISTKDMKEFYASKLKESKRS